MEMKANVLMGCRRRVGAGSETVDVLFVLAGLQIPSLRPSAPCLLHTLERDLANRTAAFFHRDKGELEKVFIVAGSISLFIQMAFPWQAFWG